MFPLHDVLLINSPLAAALVIDETPHFKSVIGLTLHLALNERSHFPVVVVWIYLVICPVSSNEESSCQVTWYIHSSRYVPVQDQAFNEMIPCPKGCLLSVFQTTSKREAQVGIIGTRWSPSHLSSVTHVLAQQQQSCLPEIPINNGSLIEHACCYKFQTFLEIHDVFVDSWCVCSVIECLPWM